MLLWECIGAPWLAVVAGVSRSVVGKGGRREGGREGCEGKVLFFGGGVSCGGCSCGLLVTRVVSGIGADLGWMGLLPRGPALFSLVKK